jgi:hypothetical protein
VPKNTIGGASTLFFYFSFFPFAKKEYFLAKGFPKNKIFWDERIF